MPKLSSKFRSTQVLIQMSVVLLAVVVLAVWQSEYLLALYVQNQLTAVGWVVNGAILALFFFGILQLVRLYLLYRKEEHALATFSHISRHADLETGIAQVSDNSIIGQRIQTIYDFFSARTEINHNALAASLLAQETSRTSFVKFINNILILTGVFGTIVSLTVALIGASTAISDTESMRGIDVVFHGMSTALSTTMTAILAYFLFGYFYLKLLDTQSYVLGQIEHITATALIPKYQAATRSPERMLQEMLSESAETFANFNQVFGEFLSANQLQGETLAKFSDVMSQNMELLSEIRSILRTGFRLRDEND